MSVFPGLCSEIAAAPYRLFLGTQPSLALEERLLRQLQPVFPWYTSRKRVKEQANNFAELDLASCDAETMLRYCHVYYVRRQLYDELVDRQLTLIETGKAAKLADPALLACLADGNVSIARRLQYELHLLQQAKKDCRVANRRELSPEAVLEPYDYLCMMRVVEEDACGVAEAEMQARAFLPRELVEAKAQELCNTFFPGGSSDSSSKKGGGGAAPTAFLERKDSKLLQRMIPSDYAKIGCVEKVRPVDVTALYRFAGERVNRLPATAEHGFKRALYGHVFRKFASHPAYLRSVSMYWARQSGMDPQSALTMMPVELAEAVCTQQHLFPALRYRAQYLYTSPEVARQQWRTDSVIPLMRLFPTLGAPAAEDLAASMAVEGEWARLQLEPGKSPLQESVVRAMQQFVESVGGLYESNRDAVWKRVEEGVKAVCPPLMEAELRAMQAGSGDEGDGQGEKREKEEAPSVEKATASA